MFVLKCLKERQSERDSRGEEGRGRREGQKEVVVIFKESLDRKLEF